MAFGSKRLPAKTPTDQARFDAICTCMACVTNTMLAGGWTPADMDPRIAVKSRRFVPTGMVIERNHVLSGGLTISHRHTYGLCVWHHRAVLLPGYKTSSMTARYGPSLLKGSKPFHAVYGSDSELIAMQDFALYGEELPDAYSALIPR